ncbi:SOS response-associated peptidase [Carboxylicivirga sp. M1479]|uniref:SOS response-associated peptidase n=1 Tax=Carboxylicivirga sp. M1479 TaxID=2594476 RepID=UPI001177B87C|nr:SOS response-associated peptidase [Carboxylicivirga sp. M1479]TRX62516.1 SOS response-associated peptidase [Carboxylicivirga sp. M1479]
MCYSAKFLIEKALKRARHYGVSEDIKRYEKELKRFKDHEKVSGFTHPEVIIYTNERPHHPILSFWGLIPNWVKNTKQAKDIWNKTLNARGETIFEKPSFKEASMHKRCLMPVAGFYEYHHKNKGTIPYYITSRDNEPLMLAGLWSEWLDNSSGINTHSCTIITTTANAMLTTIHNNPKLKEARMPVILSHEDENAWLKASSQQGISDYIKPYPQELLKAEIYNPITTKAPTSGALPYIFDED